jgi:uncharacterized protein YndB with AHSA1/START domain
LIQFELTNHLDQPVEQVFAFLTDSRNLTTWQSNLIENEQLTEGPVRVQTRFRELRKLGRKPSEIQGEFTDFEPNQRFATRTLTEPLVLVNYTFEPETGGTRLGFTFVMQTRGMMRLLEPLISRSIKQEFEEDFEKLKGVLADQPQAGPDQVRAGK